MAQHWMFGQMDHQSPRDAVDPMIRELIELLGLFNGVVEDLLGAFIDARLLETDAALESLGTVASPAFRDVRLPFWTSMPAKN